MLNFGNMDTEDYNMVHPLYEQTDLNIRKASSP